jgi:hypothetical protein
MSTHHSVSTLRTMYPVITLADLERLFAHLGFVPVYEDPDLVVYAIPVAFPWRVVAEAHVLQREGDFAIYEVVLALSMVEPPLRRVGGVWRTDSVVALRTHVVRVLQELFRAVDEPERFRCGACADGWLTWDGEVPHEGRHGRAVCVECGWQGRASGFHPWTPLR